MGGKKSFFFFSLLLLTFLNLAVTMQKLWSFLVFAVKLQHLIRSPTLVSETIVTNMPVCG